MSKHQSCSSSSLALLLCLKKKGKVWTKTLLNFSTSWPAFPHLAEDDCKAACSCSTRCDSFLRDWSSWLTVTSSLSSRDDVMFSSGRLLRSDPQASLTPSMPPSWEHETTRWEGVARLFNLVFRDPPTSGPDIGEFLLLVNCEGCSSCWNHWVWGAVILFSVLCGVCANLYRYPDDFDEGVVLRVLVRLQLKLRVHGHQIVLLHLQTGHLSPQRVELCTLVGRSRLENIIF